MTTEHNPFAAPLTSEEAPTPNTFQAEHPESLEKVRKGLLMVYISICGMLLLMIGGGVLAAAVSGGPDPNGAMGVVAIVGFGIIGMAILNLVGVCFCLAAPDASRGRPMVVASLVLQIASFLIAFSIPLLAATIGVGLAASQVMQLVTNLLSLSAVICYLLFLWRMAEYVQRPDVAGRAKRTLVIGGVSFAAIIVGGFLVGALGAGGNPAGESIVVPIGLVMFVAFIGLLVGIIMYANTITYLRKAIGEVLQGTPATNLPPIA